MRIARDGRKLALRVGDYCDLGSTIIGAWPTRQSEQPTAVRQPRRRLKELYITAEEHFLLSAPGVDSHQTLPDIRCMQFAADNRLPVGRPSRGIQSLTTGPTRQHAFPFAAFRRLDD